MTNKRSFSLPPVPALLLGIVSVQAGATVAKGIFPYMGALSTSALRIVLSAIILMIFNRPNLRGLNAQQWKGVCMYGLALGAMNILFYLAIERIPLGLGVALEFLGPLTLALLGSRRLLDFLWALIAICGIVLIAPWNSVQIDITGVLLALLAGSFWALYIVMGGRISRIMDGRKAVTAGMLFSSALVLPLAIYDGLFYKINGHYLFLGLGLALLSSAIPFTLQMIALKKIPAKTFSILLSLEPAIAALSGLFFLKEHLSFYEYSAIFLIVTASAGATLFKKKKAVELYG